MVLLSLSQKKTNNKKKDLAELDYIEERATKMFPGLEHFPNDTVLKHLRLFSLEGKMTNGGPV